MKRGLAILLIVSLLACCVEQLPEKELGWDEFVAERGMSPEDYIIEKFREHDVVFLGENHYVREEVLFLQGLIPALYENGIRTLGLEMASRDSQKDIDRLLNDPAYNETLAIRILRHWRYNWPYQEYLDIFKAAWTVNSRLPEGAPRFRIVGLDEDHGYGSKEVWGWNGLTRDRYMAETMDREIISRNEKALVYSHISHAYTRYYEANPDLSSEPYFQDLVEKGCVVNRNGTYYHLSVGNWVYEEIGERCFTIYLHGHWITDSYPDLDRFMLDHREPVGFDVEGSPLANISSFSQKLDGYIILDALLNYHPVTVTKGWVDDNFLSWYRGEREKEFSLEEYQQEATNVLEEWKSAVMRNDPYEPAKRMVNWTRR